MSKCLGCDISGSTLKVSIELPATSRHRRDMSKKIVESDVKPKSNKQTFIKTIFLGTL